MVKLSSSNSVRKTDRNLCLYRLEHSKVCVILRYRVASKRKDCPADSSRLYRDCNLASKLRVPKFLNRYLVTYINMKHLLNI